MRTWWLAGVAAVAAVAVSAAPAVADHDGVPRPPGDHARGYEMVSPPYKVSGAGVGIAPDPFSPHRIFAQANGAGAAAYVGERFALSSHLGATMLDSDFSTSNDWAFAERVSDSVGWRSHSPVTHPFRCSEDYRMQQMHQASPDLSTVVWAGNAGHLPFFAEMCELGSANDGSGSADGGSSLISDWGSPPESPTRWEPIGPLAPGQRVGTAGIYAFIAPAVSADGSHLAVSGTVRGLAGDGDPTALDTVGTAAHSAYIDDISAGLSDSWPGAGVRVPAAACTGSDGGLGEARTRVPARDGGGALAEVACEAARPGRDSRLVSDYGSAITRQSQDGREVGTSNTNVVSVDGSRTFFMAPDPGLSPFAYPGAGGCTADTGPGTRCPAQVYVRQRNLDGEVVTRWVSRPDPDLLADGYSASLLGPAYFEGASADGSRVFFRTSSPLTADDPNGQPIAPTDPRPVTTGVADPSSWDLYMFELADGSDPTGPGSELTRITRGPDGDSDCSTQPDSTNGAALRFSSQDGSRAYFVCAAPLGGVADRDATVAAGMQGGMPSTVGQANVYLYDGNVADPVARYSFVARIPRNPRGSGLTAAETLARCASTAALRGSPLLSGSVEGKANCWRGTDDGAFATFWSLGRLTGDDPHELAGSPSADIYAYDADSGELERVSRPQGPVDETYGCGEPSATIVCYADQGGPSASVQQSHANPPLSVVSDPAVAGDRVVFFESASRLVEDDVNGVFDVYRWRNGELSLVSSGAQDSDGSAYVGSSADGRNVYLLTRDRLTWQDIDSVADVYTARVGGGIPQPPPPAAACAVLADACHGGGAAPVAAAAPASQQPGGGNASPGARKRLAVGPVGRAARRRAARRGVLRVRVRSSRAGRVVAVARGRVGKRVRRLGRPVSKTLAESGATTLRIRLNRVARKRLRQGRMLRVAVVVRSPGALSKSVRFTLRRAGR